MLKSMKIFFPGAGGTEIIKKSDKITKASIKINYHGVKQTFTTENNKTFPEKNGDQTD